MWDNAVLLRNISNALIAFSVLAALCGAAYYVLHLPGLFPLRAVQLSAPPQKVDARLVLAAARDGVRGNLLTADIEQLRESLQKLPWVRSASIRRKFPNALVVTLEEHEAVARWNEDALVNREGEVFVAHSDQILPQFTGPEGAASEMLQHHAGFNRQLEALGLSVSQIALSPRHAWQLRLSNGTLLELGREKTQQRLARFVAAQTSDRTGNWGKDAGARHFDLRYRNGFAVRQAENVRG